MKKIFGALIGFVLLVAPQAIAQQDVIVLGEGDAVTIRVNPSYQDTLPPVVLPPIQDTTQLPDIIVQDTTFLPDLILQDTIPSGDPPVCRDGWTCTEDVIPDPVPDPDPVPADSSTSPPLSLSAITLHTESDTLVISWADRPQPDRAGNYTLGYYINVGNDDTGNSVVLDSLVENSPVRVVLTEEGRTWACSDPMNNFGRAGNQCDNLIFMFPEPPVVIGAHTISVTQDSTLINGNLNVIEGSWSIHLDRSDGTWAAFDQEAAPGVDSVYICSGGVCNRERRLPYELGGGRIDLLPGSYDIYWEVFGTLPDSGRAVITVTATVGGAGPSPDNPLIFKVPNPVPMEDGLMVQVDGVSIVSGDSIGQFSSMEGLTAILDGVGGTLYPDTSDSCVDRDCTPLGWYWLPAPNSGTITVTRNDTGVPVFTHTYIWN